ncbi:MAG TPA: tetratricopeptide repeat protein, partial [Treponemataceae bacterium]|nr:tetratricopeptide repeat protein [Treponemataceae bacterium]
AIDGLSQARKIEPNSFEVNYYLGVALFIKKEYAKAIPFFKKARAFNPEAQELYEKTGLSMYHAKMYKLSLPYLKRALDVNPESKEILYSLASAMNKSGNGDRALKIFMHLRPDPRFGADSCFAAGILHSNSGQIDKAIADYQIGLKHTDAPVDIQVSIRYNLSQCYLKNGNLNDTLRFLHEIQTLRPNYKDVPMLITRYQELNQNKKLQTYLIGGKTDFIALCRQIVSIYYKKAQVKIISIEQQNEMAEIQATIETEKWEDIVVFRFSRGSGSVGELFIREFHGCLRDLRAGRGVFVTAGKFSDEAVKYIEGRPIDLIDKPQLNKLLTKLHTVSELSF